MCTIEMVVGTLDLKTVTLSPDMFWLEQYKDIHESGMAIGGRPRPQ